MNQDQNPIEISEFFFVFTNEFCYYKTIETISRNMNQVQEAS